MPTKPVHATIDPDPDARRLRVAIVVSRYNASITDRLLEGAIAEHSRLGGEPGALTVVAVPGAYELPAVARAACEASDAVVALGCLIRGETHHDRVIADAVAQGLMRVALDTGVPVAFGVLTVESLEQAEARARPVGAPGARSPAGEGKRPVSNKGVEAMNSAVRAAHAVRSLRRGGAAGGRGPSGGID